MNGRLWISSKWRHLNLFFLYTCVKKHMSRTFHLLTTYLFTWINLYLTALQMSAQVVRKLVPIFSFHLQPNVWRLELQNTVYYAHPRFPEAEVIIMVFCHTYYLVTLVKYSKIKWYWKTKCLNMIKWKITWYNLI